MVEEYDESVVGTCMTMCPVEEARVRQRNGLLHYLEIMPKKSQSSHEPAELIMVKEYQRPAAGKASIQPCDLRPGQILVKTVYYLFKRIVPCSDIPWCRVYDFVFNRLRAVRQDMVIQRLCDSTAVGILEMILRFLIYADYRLCMEAVDNFDPEINKCHVIECLKRLLVLYTKHDVCCCHMGEYLAYYLLYNLGSDEVMLLALQLKTQARSCSVFMTSLSLTLAWYSGNYLRVLKMVSQLPVLHQCAINRHISRIQSHALRVIGAGAGSRAQLVSLSTLSTWLTCSIDDVKFVCASLDLLPDENGFIPIARIKSQEPLQLKPKMCQSIDSRLKLSSISRLLCGEPCSRHSQWQIS